MSTIKPPESLLGRCKMAAIQQGYDDQKKAACSRMYFFATFKKDQGTFLK